MRVAELIDHLMWHAQPNDVVFVNSQPARMTVEGTGYISIVDHMIEVRREFVVVSEAEYEVMVETRRVSSHA
jgi:hypothetical protein